MLSTGLEIVMIVFSFQAVEDAVGADETASPKKG